MLLNQLAEARGEIRWDRESASLVVYYLRFPFRDARIAFKVHGGFPGFWAEIRSSDCFLVFSAR
jgi:hypothetical protein